MKEDLLKKGDRLDDLHRNGYMLIQNPQKFCFGLDAVLLSGFAKAKPEELVMDLCSGNGVVPILMEGKTECEQFVGVEIQPDNVDMAKRSIQYNGQQDKIFMECCDLKDLDKIYNKHLFDVVGPLFAGVPGGYTRISKLAMPRRGDCAPMAVIELTRELPQEKKEAAEDKPAEETKSES